MRKFKLSVAVLMTTLLLFSQGALAISYDLSPGLVILRNKMELKKCGVVNTELSFTAQEFDKALGTSGVEYITITSLPDPKYGTLKMAGSNILQNQTISRRNIELLRFIPNENTLSECKFTFKDAGAIGAEEASCVINILSELNLSPEVGQNTIETQKNISVFKFLKAADPEGDALTFDIVTYPKKGTLKLIDKEKGCFVYIPKQGFTGKDSFEYSVSDNYGNISQTAKTEINVVKPETNIYFDDLSSHWAHNSAIKISKLGFLSGEEVDGKRYFYPDKAVSRGDFLAMAMISAGLENKVTRVYETTFADDKNIPANIKSYAAAAYDMGIISGCPTGNGGVAFESTRDISRAEASVIMQKLISAPKPFISPVFTDAAAIPSWATDAVSSLASCGILNGSGYGQIEPCETVSRAEAAEMLCNMTDYIKDNKPKDKTIFNLFGLLK